MQFINPQLLKQNLESLERLDPELVKVILEKGEPRHLKFVKTEKDELNLQYEKNGRSFFLHSEEGAAKEAVEFVATLSLKEEKIKTLYLFGSGIGYFYNALEAWLNDNAAHSLVFIENDPAIFSCLLQTETGRNIIQNPKVEFFYFKNNSEGRNALEKEGALYAPRRIKISALPSYLKQYPDLFESINEVMQESWTDAHSLIARFLTFDDTVISNYIRNAFFIPEAYRGNHLFGKFNQIPAIICGAGPSLEKNIDQLKNLTSNAIIFAASSALNALTAKGIQPHFSTYIDTKERVYERFLGTTNFEVPVFYSSRTFHRLPPCIQSPKLYINGLTNYEIATWLEKKFNIDEEPLEEGFSVTCFTTQLATLLGCNPIIYLGLDLAYTNMQRYTSGVRVGPLPKDEQMIMDNRLLKKDIFQNPIYTNRHWHSESCLLSRFIKKRDDRCFINATEGGLGINGAPNISLEEATKQHLKKSYPINQLIHSEILNTKISNISKQQIYHYFKQFLKSLKSCDKYYQKILKEFDHIYTLIDKEKDLSEKLRTKKLFHFEALLKNELAYKNMMYHIHLVFSMYVKKESRSARYLPLSNFKKIAQLLKWKSLHQQFLHAGFGAKRYAEIFEDNIQNN